MLKDALQAEIDALTGQRKTLYQQRNRGEEVSGEISTITEKLRQLRRQVKFCENIAEDVHRIKAQLQESVQEETEAAKTKQRKYERGK